MAFIDIEKQGWYKKPCENVLMYKILSLCMAIEMDEDEEKERKIMRWLFIIDLIVFYVSIVYFVLKWLNNA